MRDCRHLAAEGCRESRDQRLRFIERQPVNERPSDRSSIAIKPGNRTVAEREVERGQSRRDDEARRGAPLSHFPSGHAGSEPEFAAIGFCSRRAAPRSAAHGVDAEWRYGSRLGNDSIGRPGV